MPEDVVRRSTSAVPNMSYCIDCLHAAKRSPLSTQARPTPLDLLLWRRKFTCNVEYQQCFGDAIVQATGGYGRTCQLRCCNFLRRNKPVNEPVVSWRQIAGNAARMPIAEETQIYGCS